MQALRSLALGLARAAIWPLVSGSAGLRGPGGPWPRSLGILVSAVMTGAAIAIFVHDLLRWLAWPSGLAGALPGRARSGRAATRRGGPVRGRGGRRLAPAGLSVRPRADRARRANRSRPRHSAGCSSWVTSCWSGERASGCCAASSPLLGWLSLPLSSAPDPELAGLAVMQPRRSQRPNECRSSSASRSSSWAYAGLSLAGPAPPAGRGVGVGRHGRDHRAGCAGI